MSHPKTKTVEIPFVKKGESDLPKLKFTYFNTSTKKMKIFQFMTMLDILKSSFLNGNKIISVSDME